MAHFKTPVRDYMSSPVRAISADAPATDADRVLREHTISSLAVLDGAGRPVGVVSRTDLLRVGRAGERRGRQPPLLALPPELRVRDLMREGVLHVAPEASVHDAARIMVAQRVHRVYVGTAEQLVGVFSTKDVMDVVAAARLPRPLSDFMSSPVQTVDALDTIAAATERLAAAHIAGLVVLDEREHPVGVFTQTEALQARELPASTPVEDVMNYALLCLDIATPMHRAAQQAAATRARRVIAVEHRRVWGILTGIDFARAAA